MVKLALQVIEKVLPTVIVSWLLKFPLTMLGGKQKAEKTFD